MAFPDFASYCQRRLNGNSTLFWFLVFVSLAPTSGFMQISQRKVKYGPPSSLFAVGLPEENLAENINTARMGYIRWNTRSSKESDIWELQTAMTTFQRTNPYTKRIELVELHAQVHYGNEAYFDYFNDPEFQKEQDEILYELLVDESLLGMNDDKSGRVLTQRLQASPNDQSVARNYGWDCQVDVIDYTHPKFKHADFTRQELLNEQQRVARQTRNFQINTNTNSQPLWQQISKSGTEFWQPAVSALLVGPPSLLASTDAAIVPTKRKLFTNLFLPGNQLAGWLRATLWITVPTPEISVLLLDWSSLFLTSKSSARFSQVTLPILQSFMTLQISQLRQLIFGQILVAGNSAQQQKPVSKTKFKQSQDWDLLVTKRNDHALQVLQSSLGNKTRISLLYGCSHCPDLHSKLVKEMGFAPFRTEWRTAWSLSVPKTFPSDKTSSDVSYRVSKESVVSPLLTELASSLPPTAWAALFVLFPFYLGVGAVDWIDTIHISFRSLLDNHDSLSFASDWVLYLLRHVILYVGVSKFALEWKDFKEA